MKKILLYISLVVAFILIGTTWTRADGTITAQALASDIEATITLTATGNTSPVQVVIRYGQDATALTLQGNALNSTSTTVTIPVDSSAAYHITGLTPTTTYYYIVTDALVSTVTYTNQASFATNPSGQGYGVGQGATAAPTCAAGPDGYCLLAPLGGVSIITDSDLSNYFGLIYRILIGLAGVFAVIMIFFGGVQYMTTDALGQKEEARKRITGAIWGLIIALGSFAILNTINPKLLDFTFGVNKVSVGFKPADIDTDTPHTAVNGKYCMYQNHNTGYQAGSAWGAETISRTQLAAAPLQTNVNNPACVNVGDHNCTSLTGLDTTGIQKLRTACPNCELTITGGTECWLHSARTGHAKNASVVDLRNNASAPNLVAFVKATANSKGNLPGWGNLYVINGMEFVD